MEAVIESSRVGDIEIAYRVAGTGTEGTPWVFVHGLGEDSRSWKAQLDVLGESRPVYAVDVRGHGGTTLGNADGTLAQLGGDLLRFLATIGPSVCVGFSMGGAIVLQAAAMQDSPLVRHAICVCTSSIVGSRVADRFRTRADGIDSSGREYARAALIENLTTNVLQDANWWTDDLEERLTAIGDGAGYANGARAMASMNAAPLTPRLESITVPVDVFVGEHDTSCPWKVGEIIVDAVPDGRCHLLPGVGHFVNIEDPGVLTRSLLGLSV